ncbi:Flp family type IVb pilin [Vibrio paucivorans]
MYKLINNIQLFIDDDEGLTVVEYVVGAGLIVVGFSGLFVAFNGILASEFSSLFSS